MKTKCIVLIFVICTTALQIMGQHKESYQPVVVEGEMKWYIPITQMFAFFVDTIYSVPSSDGYFELWYNGRWYHYEDTYLGKIRSSADNSRLFLLDPEATEERLIMDLNLNVGDKFYSQQFDGDSIVVDSVYMESGRRHVRFNQYIPLWSPLGTAKFTFIEGIGPNWGFSSQGEAAIIPFYIICKYENEGLVYSISNSYVENCNFKDGSSIPVYNMEKRMSVSPNPATDKITVTLFPEMKLSEIHAGIYNLLGENIFQQIVTVQDSEFQMDISRFPEGVYFLMINGRKGEKSVCKFIKH